MDFEYRCSIDFSAVGWSICDKTNPCPKKNRIAKIMTSSFCSSNTSQYFPPNIYIFEITKHTIKVRVEK